MIFHLVELHPLGLGKPRAFGLGSRGPHHRRRALSHRWSSQKAPPPKQMMAEVSSWNTRPSQSWTRWLAQSVTTCGMQPSGILGFYLALELESIDVGMDQTGSLLNCTSVGWRSTQNLAVLEGNPWLLTHPHLGFPRSSVVSTRSTNPAAAIHRWKWDWSPCGDVALWWISPKWLGWATCWSTLW